MRIPVRKLGGAEFREWLVQQVMGTAAARYRLESVQLDELAAAMGLQPDVLVEARNRLRGVEGSTPDMGVGGQYALSIRMPVMYRDLLSDHAKMRGIDHTILTRSLVHHYLTHNWEPDDTKRPWDFNGRPIDPSAPTLNYQTYLSQGAGLALGLRCRRLHYSISGLTRALFRAAMDGTWARPPELVKTYATADMFNDPKRYIT